MGSNNIPAYPEYKAIEEMVEENNPEEALIILEKSYDEKSRSANVWNDIGVLYYKTGNLSSSINAFCRALELEPDNQDASENLTQVEETTKEKAFMDSGGLEQGENALDHTTLLERRKLIREKIADPGKFFYLNTIYFSITSFCNYKCKQCFDRKNREKSGDKRKYMSFDNFVRYFNKVVLGMQVLENAFGFKYQRNKILIHPQGLGEPLIHPKFSEVINYITDNGFPIKLTTNGSLLYGKRADALFNANLNELHVSIDAATPETYAEVRQAGQFEKVVNNLKQFMDRYQGRKQRPVFVVSFFNAPHNRKDLKLFCDYWAPRVDLIWIQKYIDTLNQCNANEKPDANNVESINRIFCNRLPGFFMIEENGETKGCQCGKYIAGNLQEQSFEEIFLSKQRIHVFECQEKGFFHKIKACRDCTLWKDKIQTSRPYIISINNRAYFAQKSVGSLHIRNTIGADITTLDNNSLYP